MNGMKLVLRLVVFSVLVLGCCALVTAEPEYMQLKAQAGKAYEIKGRWDTAGYFIAVDIQELPNPRRPKLRGGIQLLDTVAKTIYVFGRRIEVEEDTQFLGEDSAKSGFAHLTKGQRIEVTCKIDTDDGEWEAVSIETANVKSSEKIKGTISKVQIDGKSPDTLNMYGLIILLTNETDVNDKNSSLDDKESKLFKDWSDDYELGMFDGVTLGEKVLLSAEVRQDVLVQHEYDLTSTYRSDATNTQTDLRFKGKGEWTSSIETETEIRFRRKFIFTDQSDRLSGSLVSQVTRLNVLFRRIGGVGIAARIGRQRFDEPREWLFDEYLDAVRVWVYQAERFNVEGALIHAVHPVDSLYDTWTDVYASIDWQPKRKNSISIYVLRRSDSDTLRNREPLYIGGRYYGKISGLVEPWVDYALMRGNDKGRDLDAWALDCGATLFLSNPQLKPHVTIGYAIGSGDSKLGDQTDQRFRQTGYQDNSGRFGGLVAFKYYGEILNPELSNLKILSVGTGVRLGAQFGPSWESSVDLMYHRYQQSQPENQIKGADLVSPAHPKGAETDLGWAMTLVLGSPRILNRVRIALVLERFSPGKAFVPGNAFAPKLDPATMARINISVAV